MPDLLSGQYSVQHMLLPRHLAYLVIISDNGGSAMNKFMYTIMQFMVGRNGPDQLYRDMMLLWFVLFIIKLFFPSTIFSLLLFSLLFLAMFRMLSRNVDARRRENARYMRIRTKILSKTRMSIRKIRDRKIYAYRDCPQCKTTLRLPYKRGEHDVVCPKCRHEFHTKIK